MISYCLLMKLILLWLLTAGTALAAPRTPRDDAEVLERLPLRRDDPAMVEVRKLSGVPLARRYFELAMAQGDPRFVGYAEAALRSSGAGNADAYFVRALLRQYRHDFDGALEDLERALQADPAHAEARAWRAAIHMVRADYAAARRECAALAPYASQLTAAGCMAYADAATGSAGRAYAALGGALAASPDAPKETRLWALTRLAEMAIRLGDTAGAERHFRDALALGIDDNFLLAAYADFLLEQSRPREVIALLGKWSRSDTLLLRLAIAQKRLAMKEAESHARALGERFAAAALRGERLHLAEEARYLLELKGDARAALAAAAENWRSQREPRDALVLLQAAVAAKDAAAARPVLQWLESSGLEDPVLRKLAAGLK